jgi:RNA polymerase sigma factor (sigma-70 family)
MRSAAKADRPGLTDRELLRRFARGNDQAAFAALAARHTGMVLGVCRRALPTVQDAEDACQTTFLLLAKKARGVRWQASVANWLFTTARKVAHNARVAAQRRARREAGAAVPEAVEPVDRMTGRELLAALDEELERLPPCYREPLVLCYLEGLTRDQAAARLGVPLATLHTRIDRGRKRLHAALTKSGCALGAGLLALAVTSPAGASPPRLVESVLAAATGSPPAAVAALAEGVAVNGVVNKSLPALAAVIGCAALGVGLGAFRSSAVGQPLEKPATAAAAARGPAPSKQPAARAEPTVAGRVLAPDGKPLAGAKLLLIGKGDRPGELGTSGTDGRFAVPLPKDWTGGTLVARAEGVGIDFAPLGESQPGGDFELRTVADHPIRGRVVDTEGKPVAGARVSLLRLGTSAGNSLGPILDEWKQLKGTSATPSGEKGIWEGAGALWTAVTDRDGRFEFRGVGVERLAALRVEGGGATALDVYVANRPGFDPKEYNEAVVKNARAGFGGGKPRWHLSGPDFSAVAEREKPIRGRVTDAATGQPRAGVHVLLTRSRSDLLPVIRDGWTDADGRYEIKGARKAAAYMVEVAADPAAGYMPCQGWADDTTGYEPVTIDLRPKKGVVVTGRMIEKATGKPVRGFAMIGVPQGNPSVKDYPEFNSSAWFPIRETDADGRFRVVAVPGPVLLMGGPNNYADFAKYKPPAADPKYPQFFQKFGDHTAYTMAGGLMSPLQGRFCKVLEVPPGATVIEQDIVLEPADQAPAKPGAPGEAMPKPPAANGE